MRFYAGIAAAIALFIAGMVLVTSSAEAHPLPDGANPAVPALHKICSAIGICRDQPPRPGPMKPCGPHNDGEIDYVWDQRLGGYVEWECICAPACHWHRIGITHVAGGLPWDPPHRRWVVDAQRACASIVCKRVWVEHFYPTQWIFGR